MSGASQIVENIYRRVSILDAEAKASDGLITFTVIWALALIFSTVSHVEILLFSQGTKLALLEYIILGIAVMMLIQPRKLWLLAMLAGAMVVQYIIRLPVASNNQTIAFFMNMAICFVFGIAWLRNRSGAEEREEIYENLRVVARYLLAIMYFYGIFHKINTDFLDPEVSCAVALYKPLTSFFGFEDNLLGRYAAIYATFIVEGIAIVSLFWRRYFAVGLIISLWFHYAIPISAYSWYMDFSCLVFALYTLSVPREVSVAFYSRSSALLRRVPRLSGGVTAVLLLTAALVIAIGIASMFAAQASGFEVSNRMAWHSSWLVIWAIVGGVIMIVLTWASLDALPYRPTALPRRPAWIYVFPIVLFISCLSPYVGLKTESSIAMFSNLHTEGGETNHLLFSDPPYLFDYQRDIARVTASSNQGLSKYTGETLGITLYDLERWLDRNPDGWASFDLNGRHYEKVNAASFPIRDFGFFERQLLLFKPIDFAKPKVCTH